MRLEEALNLALDSVIATNKKEIVNIEEALNRVLATDIECIKDLPTYDNSAMDGYAFKHSDIGNSLKVVATILAGDIQEPILKDNECYKIMTGAKVPRDCDTIAPKEICQVSDNEVVVTKDIKLGNALRLKGEEQQKGSTLLEKGEILNPSKIALLASQGITEVECFKELKIAIISTGSELKEPNQEATEDELYNINGINIKMHLLQYGIKSRYLGTLPDTLNGATEFFGKLKGYDIVFTSGGVSGGDADFTKEALKSNGFKELFHGLSVKPGHPILMGSMDNTFIIALPGNPLAAIVHTLIMGLPIIFKKMGAKYNFFDTTTVNMAKDLKLKPNRVNIVLGNVNSGEFSAYKDNRYGSGMITPLVESNAIALFGESVEVVAKNQQIRVVLLQSPISKKSFDYINS